MPMHVEWIAFNQRSTKWKIRSHCLEGREKFTSSKWPKMLWFSDNLSIGSVNLKCAQIFMGAFCLAFMEKQRPFLFGFRSFFRSLYLTLYILMTSLFDLRNEKRKFARVPTRLPALAAPAPASATAAQQRWWWPKFQGRHSQRLNLLHLFGFYYNTLPIDVAQRQQQTKYRMKTFDGFSRYLSTSSTKEEKNYISPNIISFFAFYFCFRFWYQRTRTLSRKEKSFLISRAMKATTTSVEIDRRKKWGKNRRGRLRKKIKTMSRIDDNQ